MTIKSICFAIPAVLCVWFGVLVGVGLVSDQTPARLVLFPSDQFLHNLPDGASIVSMNEWAVTVSSPQSGLAHALYNHGAWVVLPAGLMGCAPVARTT